MDRRLRPQVAEGERRLGLVRHGRCYLAGHNAAEQAVFGHPGMASGRPTRIWHDGRMAGRAVLITGASRGIGRATAIAFARAGDRVAIHHRDSAGLAKELAASLPGDGHLVVSGDLADPTAV